MSIDPDDEADAEFREAIGLLIGDNRNVVEAYRRMRKFLVAECRDGPLHAGDFCEAMAYFMGEVAAENMSRDYWRAAFEFWFTCMHHAAERRRAN
jgi:hypothetical protein